MDEEQKNTTLENLVVVSSKAVGGKTTNIPSEVKKILGISEDTYLEWIINTETKEVSVRKKESTLDVLRMFGDALEE